MATIALTQIYADLPNNPTGLLAPTDGSQVTASTSSTFSYTFSDGTEWAGYTVTATGTGFTYDGSTPIDGILQGFAITDPTSQTVLQITGIAPDSLASDLSALVGDLLGFTDPSGGGANPNPKSGWSLLLSGDDTIVGSDGGDWIGVGGVNAGNDLFTMGAGDDLVSGGLGNDTIHGGDGWDILDYSTTHFAEGLPMVRGLTVQVDAGTVLDPYGFTDTFTGIEEIDGTATRDTFIGGAKGMDFYGLRGADVIIGGSSGQDWVVYRDDVWNGGRHGIVAHLGDTVAGGDNLGTIRDGFGTIDQVTNINNVVGTRYRDIFVGNAADNKFSGGEGRDYYQGGHGKDQVSLYANFTDATQHGATVNLTLASGQIVDDGYGNTETARSIENIGGTAYDDRITGTRGVNVFSGYEGNDTLTGGGGRDHFVFSIGDIRAGRDEVTDFHAAAGSDRDVLGFDFSADGLSTVLHLVIGAAATEAVATFVFDPTTHILSYDADGTGSGLAVDIAKLDDVTTLTSANFDLF